MSFSEVFGGDNIFPAQLTYLAIDLDANVVLQWATEVALPGQDVMADIMDVTPDAGGRSITFPDATIAGPGQSVLVNNVGAFTFSVLDNGGSVIGSVPSGEVWQFYLSDSSDADGIWQTFQFGTGASSATAAALAGAGLKAITTTLNVQVTPRTSAISPIVIIDSDRAKVVAWTGGVGAGTLPDPATLGSDWFVYLRNSGTGAWTITPAAGTVDGDTTLVLTTGGSALLYTDGVNYYTVGLSNISSTNFDYTSINVAGTGTYTLAGTELNRIAYKFTGVLTGTRTIVVPNTIQQYWINNATSSATPFALIVKTAAGAGVTIAPGQVRMVYSDGTSVVIGQAGMLPAAYCMATRAVDQAVPGGAVLTDLTFTDEPIDVGSWFSPTSASFTVPLGVTIVELAVTVIITDVTAVPETSWDFVLIALKNGSTLGGVQYDKLTFDEDGFKFTVQTGVTIASVTAGDIIKFQLSIDSDPNNNGGNVVSRATLRAIG